jgi:hypothetical protein
MHDGARPSTDRAILHDDGEMSAARFLRVMFGVFGIGSAREP